MIPDLVTERTLPHPLLTTEAALIAAAWVPLLVQRIGAVRVEPGPTRDQGDTVEHTFHLHPGKTPFPGFDGAWTLELIYTRPAHRQEDVVVPQDPRLAPLAINKGQLSLTPSGDGTRITLEGVSQCRLPLIRRWVDPWARRKTEKLFTRWVDALDEAIRAQA